jgi:hypothetical protein
VKGLRTFIGTMVAMGLLTLAFILVAPDRRHEAFFAYAGGVVGALSALAAKSVGSAAVGGDGLKEGWKNLTTKSKPTPPEP